MDIKSVQNVFDYIGTHAQKFLVSLLFYFFFLSFTHSRRLKAFKMNRIFLKHEAYIIQEANILFSLYSPSSGLLFIIYYCYNVLILLFLLQHAFSFFFHFAEHSYYHSYSSLSYYVKGILLTRVTKKRGHKRKAAPIT